ncbi:restriction endonuclease [Leeuwenhoekiella marinoflava]|uniref:Type III restriction enzyme n=2 Tax=Leeuwenhoekiella marinoflava TaxID=988 RepID=A0A4Q0PLX1_9FLAO|nr:DEAD/DEAH box helicase family protein [Leeuwenhoekiella marinoflava]RXG30691.1 type III restriction enzyme [Leeuwenhoekiella marinoflava]SHF19508.1 type III restriction enzyme [Leeuwenhoekiella marinoflava DSM 3653]
MKLTFESDLQFQQDAIKSITDLFEGQPLEDAVQEFDLTESGTLSLINGVGNNLVISEEQILSNLQDIQETNEIKKSTELDGMNFSVEMETGTGKTYVYLRTIYELNTLYNFKKFVIVVPSVAIREGVLKNLEITTEHFQNLYDNVPVNFQVYDSSKVSALRSFATNNNIEILVINIDSFAKDQNIINQPHYKVNGRKPIEFIQSTNPFVIIDEPQNMETEKRTSAIKNLNAICTLRYSATHRNQYNLTYSLNPVKAYDLGLVKQIEVDSIIEENAFNDAFVSVDSITATKTKVTAKVFINVNDKGGVKKKKVTVSVGKDLYDLSNEREIYSDGYLVEEIDATNGCISLSNGSILYKGDSQGGLTDELMKFQIRKTIEEHLKKQKRLNKLGIKVLSLFFIDKVANYRSYDADGNSVQGKFASWFEEIFNEYISKSTFQGLNLFPVSDVHNGYFSQDKKGKLKDTSGETKADDDTYSLIMKDKEKLLNLENPLQFIFSHSALREGWDNPNVFQICTLNETKSDMKKRQEIGRGLRLAVDQNGKRTYDQNINRLTVIANESYDDFAKTLQKEIEDECGVTFKDRIKNKRTRTPIKYRKGFDADPKFLEIWENLKKRTTYRVDYKTSDLITLASKSIKDLPEIKAPSVRSTKVKLHMTDEGLETSYAGDKVETYDSYTWPIPDVLGYIQNKTELTRSTLQAILSESGRIPDILINPQLFLDLASQAIKRTLYDLMIDGIKYEKIGGSEYEMALFEAQELEVYLNDFTFNVSDSSKTIYEEFIPLDSGVESKFAEDCETSDQIQFYFKLPTWFKIPTPIGTYNPDWAVVFKDDKKIYFVAETKDTGSPEVDLHKLSADEQLKIKCGKAHFNEFDALEYKVVNKVGQLIH